MADWSTPDVLVERGRARAGMQECPKDEPLCKHLPIIGASSTRICNELRAAQYDLLVWYGLNSEPGGAETDKAGIDARKSSASFRRISGESGKRKFVWGWSRMETDRLVRMQAIARGWLLRRKVCHIPAREVETILKDLHQKDKGLRRLVAYLFFFSLFFACLLLESDVAFQHAVETSMRDFIAQIGFGPDDRRLHDVASREDFSSWALALYVAMYDGTEVEDVCNTCAASREPGGYLLFPEFLAGISSELSVGQEIPLAGGGSFILEFNSCPLCYGSARDSVVDSGPVGDAFCNAICTGMEYCFEGRCNGVQEPTPLYGEVKGTNESLVLVSSNADCGNASIYEAGFPTGFGARVGLTSIIASQTGDLDEDIVVYPTGRGIIANRNKILGTLLLEWTYFSEGQCEDQYRSNFYKTCYTDEGLKDNRIDQIRASVMNPLVVVDVAEGYPGVGLVYSITNDVGLYDTGLNVNLCGMLGILDGDDIISDAARTISLRFNTYNGRRDGLFASVSITATFSLGGEVQVVTDVKAFSMPNFFEKTPMAIGRAVAIFLFAIMLAYCIAKGIGYLMRELRDGHHRLKMSLTRLPVTTVRSLEGTLVHMLGNLIFMGNLVLWTTTAITASRFQIDPTLAYDDASEQVRAFSTELAFVALERWKRDALAVAGSVVGLARLFLMLRFHPRLSLVTDVLAASVVHLAHFFIMFFMVVGVYSNIGWVLFGTASDLFATWTLSFITMTRIALGEFDSIYPELFAINNPAGFLIIITYQTLQFILLLNIVISILLDAFQVVQAKNDALATDTLRQTVMTTLGRWRIQMIDLTCAMFRPGGLSSNAGSGLRKIVPAGVVARYKRHRGKKARVDDGMTRLQRIAMSNRTYDMRTAAEVLRRSPLPESAVRRKMRQIIDKRRDTKPSGTPFKPDKRSF